jgi:hypothetical protein
VYPIVTLFIVIQFENQTIDCFEAVRTLLLDYTLLLKKVHCLKVHALVRLDSNRRKVFMHVRVTLVCRYLYLVPTNCRRLGYILEAKKSLTILNFEHLYVPLQQTYADIINAGRTWRHRLSFHWERVLASRVVQVRTFPGDKYMNQSVRHSYVRFDSTVLPGPSF